MAQIQPPETFDFSTPNEWPKWRKRFERYLVVSGMKKKEEADKIDLFMYLMGDRADDIFRTFKFEKEEEATKIDSVLKAFDSHFCVRKNIIYERAKFNSRIQEDREPVDEFITSLYKLADSCEFEGFHEQLIRDRIVVGVRDKALSERMQLDSELTLEKAVKMVRQQEAVRQQQVDLQRPSTSQKVDQVKFNSKKQSPKQQQQPSRKKEKSAKTRLRCPKCGGFTHREGQACRAEGQRCNLCSKTGHFANCCPDKQAKTAEVKAVSELDEEIGFLLEVSAVEDSSNLDDDEGECRRRWTAEIQVNGKQVKFKLDSQADVTCVPLCLFKKIMGQQRLVKSDINLRAAEFSELQTVGMFISTLRNGNYEIKEKIYVNCRLSEPLLSRRACELLNLARRIEVVATRINPIKEFPEVFEGLGQIGNPYEIKLKPGAKPYAVHTPRRVPIPLMEKLKTRLEELDKDEILTKIFEAQLEDMTLKAVVNYLEKGWPDKKKMSQALLSCWHVKDELGVQNGLLMRSCRLVIPASMKLEILDKLHAGHFGITKTRLRARETVWWPGISEEIAEAVRKCSVCIQEAVSKHEPLIPTNFPTRPWQKIGMDLFKFENKWYLVVIDYYSRFPEMIQLDRLTANVVVRSCKSIFARHGIPETVVSDNGTQFGAAREFANFARQYGFTHVTSSPRFPQSNGMAEAGVKIAKLILKKNQDPSLGLLEYRSTPLENGYSPAELLMGRKLRTTLPIAPDNLNPKLVDSQTLKRKEGRRRKDMKSRYDRRCGATDMEELSEGDTVWITDMRTWGIVKKKASTPRSYMVDTPVGTLRRNRFHLRKGYTVQYPADPSTPTFSGEELVENEKTPVVDYPSNDSEDGQIRTRSGRIVKPIHTSLVNGRPGADGPTEALKEFTKARYVRLRLQKIRTLNADLMTMESGDHIDKSVTRRYFYSIKDISIGGQCICNGHAKDCTSNTTSTRQKCRCEHNTCGDHCDRCCPLYNQKLWKPGTNLEGFQCEECQCYGHADKCVYEQSVADARTSINTQGVYEGGGVCSGCKHHTAGINCERCADRYYRPAGVRPDDSRPCRKCQCNGPGMSGLCVPDDKNIHEGLVAYSRILHTACVQNPGQCLCRPGYKGRRCEQCDLGHRNYPRCEACFCDPRGTATPYTCQGPCRCKANVEGERCDKCKANHYDLATNNPDGCSSCFCFGVTNRCTEGTWGVNVTQTMYRWKITNLDGTRRATPLAYDNTLHIANDDMVTRDTYFWEAPPEYLGKKLYSYGGELHFTISYIVDRGDTSGTYVEDADVIFEGSNGVRLGYNWATRPGETGGDEGGEGERLTIDMPLREHNWFVMNPNGGRTPVSRETFASTLLSLSRLLVRAKFHTDQIEGVLYNVGMEEAAKDSLSVRIMKGTEICSCPPGYTGLSCEDCTPDYRRVNTSQGGFVCEPCDCNNHAESCDSEGRCVNCLHQTTGVKCDRCLPGYYGDAKVGTPGDCKRCACPLEVESNNFSPTCTAVTTPSGEEDYVCTACPAGYGGSKCEICVEGYFGSPQVPGSFCQPCDCSGNVNTSLADYCDRTSGRCLHCTGHTTGWTCNECLPGHYGSAVHHNCRLCDCNPYGSEGTDCDPVNGQCFCKENYVGRTCSRCRGFPRPELARQASGTLSLIVVVCTSDPSEKCQEGYGNVEAGCVPCWCNRAGSQSEHCDPVSGQCPCKPGVFGSKCDSCLPGHYGFSEEGCRLCDCHPRGSTSPECDETTGQCQCRPHVTRRPCDRCEPGYWNLETGEGCTQCQCNATGSLAMMCDDTTGQCQCKPGIGGRHCDHCLPGWYGLTPYGCRRTAITHNTQLTPDHIYSAILAALYMADIDPEEEIHTDKTPQLPDDWCVPECDPCDAPGHICDSTNGRCVCPPHTTGERCQYCQPTAWGYHPTEGCKSCDCNPRGSQNQQCDQSTGECICLEGFEGRHCDRCRHGFFQFPHCQRCECDPQGTNMTLCDLTGHCQCDERGQCPCKVSVVYTPNVIGNRCDRCKDGAFGLSVDNSRGCYDCFCFGRSQNCEQANLAWSHEVTMASREVTMDVGVEEIVKVYGYQVIPGHTGSVSMAVPYVLDQPLYWSLPKDFLGDKVSAYNGRLHFRLDSPGGHSHFPGTMLQRFPLVVLQGNHRVILTHKPMEVPADGRYVVRIHEDDWLQAENIHLPVTRAMMMVALQNLQHILIRGTVGPEVRRARLYDVSLELAVSTPRFTPSLASGVESCSCPPNYVGPSCQDPAPGYYRKFKPNYLDSKDILDLVGWAEPCDCNNRSRECDRETGICYNCTDSSSGPHCELCSKGFYEDVARKRCLPCSCPLPNNR
ncbi:LAMA2 [Cordylochernes scorpioides]|uniref:LAMA2 n=1 Tax=Cordylochernes scorpioides TaxID=51811 RepID=A0ABY6L6U8_9ARAC|nr:LAMA2 [Cordylochernes scorpioides]